MDLLASSLLPLLFLFSAYLLICDAAPDRCGKEISVCLKDIQTVLNDTKLAFAQDEEQLDMLCRHLNQTVSCVNEFILYCLGAELQKQYNAMISGTLTLIDQLCTPSSEFRRKYLTHAKCYHDLAEDYQKCAQVYYENEKGRVQTVRETNDISSELRLWCCNYDGHRACTKTAVGSECGPEAADLAEQIVVISGGDIVRMYCSNYTISSPQCSSLVSASPPTTPSLSPASSAISLATSYILPSEGRSLFLRLLLPSVFLFLSLARFCTTL